MDTLRVAASASQIISPEYINHNLYIHICRYSLLENMDIYDLDPYFLKIITCLKTNSTFLCKITSKTCELFQKGLELSKLNYNKLQYSNIIQTRLIV